MVRLSGVSGYPGATRGNRIKDQWISATDAFLARVCLMPGSIKWSVNWPRTVVRPSVVQP